MELLGIILIAVLINIECYCWKLMLQLSKECARAHRKARMAKARYSKVGKNKSLTAAK